MTLAYKLNKGLVYLYLERVKAKGNHYLYLRTYDRTITYSKNKKVTLYSFGRLEEAPQKISRWKRDIKSLPEELKEVGCTQDDLRKWERRALAIIQQKLTS